jgi:hypothetical protein
MSHNSAPDHDHEGQCDPELADFIEDSAAERGEEAACALMRLMERIEDSEKSHAEISHEWMHGLSGFLGGLLTTLAEEAMIDLEDMESAVAYAAIECDLDLGSSDDSDDLVTELEDEHLQSFLEMAQVTGMPVVGEAVANFVASIERELEAMAVSAVEQAPKPKRLPPQHVIKGVLLAELVAQLARVLRAVPDVGYGLSRVAVQTAMSETIGEQEDAAVAAATEVPQAIRRAQVVARTARRRTAAAKSAETKAKATPKKRPSKRRPAP